MHENIIFETIPKMQNKNIMRIAQEFNLDDRLRENKMKGKEMRIGYLLENE